MKKGLLLTLVVVVALIASVGFSYAPVIKSIPDIIIGDQEQGDANNFFVFSDALTFDTYVTDNDSTISDMKWSFAQIGGTQEITVNDLAAETADPTYVDPTNDIRLGNTTASFRNETLSPKAGTTPYPDPTVLSDAHLVFYVSDGAFKDSDDFMVYTVDNGVDGYSSGIDPVYTESWDSNTKNWNLYTSAFAVGPTQYGRYDSANKRIIMASPAAGWPTWYSFQIPKTVLDMEANLIVPYNAGMVYAVKAKMSSDANTTVPMVRIRVQDDDFVWASSLTAAAVNGDPLSVAGEEKGFISTTPQDFMVVVYPQGSTKKAYVAFDEWEYGTGGSTYTGTIYIDDLRIYEIPVASIGAAPAIADITAFGSGWTTATGVTINASNVQYTDTTTWHGIGRMVTLDSAMTAGDVYRIKYRVAKTAGTTRLDDLRIRINDAQNGSYVSEITFDDTRDAVNPLITSTPTDFVHYHAAKNGRGVVAPFTGYDLAIWCDQIQKVASTATMTLDRITIEKVTLPELN